MVFVEVLGLPRIIDPLNEFVFCQCPDIRLCLVVHIKGYLLFAESG
jgi:hypothetical protein